VILLGPDDDYYEDIVEWHHMQMLLKKLRLASKEMKHASTDPLHPPHGCSGDASDPKPIEYLLNYNIWVFNLLTGSMARIIMKL
jgi:hypothetical protein